MGVEGVGHGEQVVSELPSSQGVPTWFTAQMSAPQVWDVCKNGNAGMDNGGIQGQCQARFFKQHKESVLEFLSTDAVVEAQSNWQAFQMPYSIFKCIALGDSGGKDSARNLVYI